MTSSSEQKDLGRAAKVGDVEFLRECFASKKPLDYYLTLFPFHSEKGCSCNVNFLYVAASHNREVFIREAIEGLPDSTLQQLLLQQFDPEMWNPLHVAASFGNLAIVKLFLKVFHSSSSSSPSQKPWLQTDSHGGLTPCFLALRKDHEDCGMEILKMDIQTLPSITDNDGTSLLYEAVSKGFNEFAVKVLESGHPFSYAGFNGFTPLHFVTNCADGKYIFREVLKREPLLVKQKSVDDLSILHSWATVGKLWPFECILECNDIIPDIRSVVVELMCATNFNGQNPLHYLGRRECADEEAALKITELLINTYKQEVSEATQSSSIVLGDGPSWFVKDNFGGTPLSTAIQESREKLAILMISADERVLLKQDDPLFWAIEHRCHEVTQMILDIVDEKGWIQLLTNQHNENALHVAPQCKRDILERLHKDHPELIDGVDKEGSTILHCWVRKGQIEPFEYVLHESQELGRKWRVWRHKLVKQISAVDYSKKNNPLHTAAMANVTDEATSQEIAKLLVQAFKEEITNWRVCHPNSLPWFTKNDDGDGPMHLAIVNQREAFALFILSLHIRNINELLEFYQPVHKTLFLAIQNNCYQVARQILNTLDKGSWNNYLTSHSDGRNIMHLAPFCTDKSFGTWLVKEASEFISIPDKNGHTPLEEASMVGEEWIINAMLERSPSVFNKVPLAWVKACENGHVSAIQAFINKYPRNFKDHCIQHQDSPLHHIQLPNLTGYREFLKIPDIKDLINIQNSRGKTPLHQAILSGNKLLTEILLNVDDIDCSIKDDEDKTAIDLLTQICKEQPEWIQMCKSSQLGIDPTKNLTYFKHKKKLLDARSTLSVVAALIATITFAAGFTLPGGFDQNTGKAMLGKKAAFIVFIISDTLAMCCSILIMIWVIMSLVNESTKGLVLIDRSMKLLIASLYCTLLAFMTGVYVVLSSKSLYAAIFIIVICSLTVLLALIILLPNVLGKSSILRLSNVRRQDRAQLLEQGGVPSSPGHNGRQHAD